MMKERSVAAVTNVEESDAAHEGMEAALQGRGGRDVLGRQVARVLEQVIQETSHAEHEAMESNN